MAFSNSLLSASSVLSHSPSTNILSPLSLSTLAPTHLSARSLHPQNHVRRKHASRRRRRRLHPPAPKEQVTPCYMHGARAVRVRAPLLIEVDDAPTELPVQ